MRASRSVLYANVLAWREAGLYLRPNSVEPNPKQPVGGEEPKLTRPLPAQDGHLMSQRDELKLQ